MACYNPFHNWVAYNSLYTAIHQGFGHCSPWFEWEEDLRNALEGFLWEPWNCRFQIATYRHSWAYATGGFGRDEWSHGQRKPLSNDKRWTQCVELLKQKNRYQQADETISKYIEIPVMKDGCPDIRSINFDSTLRDENFSISSCKVRTSSSLVHVQSWHQGSIGIKRWEFHGGVMFATRENPWKKKNAGATSWWSSPHPWSTGTMVASSNEGGTDVVMGVLVLVGS